MNNEDIIRSVVCLLAGDGEINQQEMRFLQNLRKQLGVTSEVLNTVFEEARKGRGRVQIPEDTAERKHLFEFLVQAVVVDGRLVSEERKMLNLIAAKMEISGMDVEASLSQAVKSTLSSPTAKPQAKNKKDDRISKPPGRIKRRTAPVTTSSPINPKIWIERDMLYAETAWIVQILYLFSYCRRVEVDRRKSEIRISTRWLWFFTTHKTIPFSRLAARSPFETKYASSKYQQRRGFSYQQVDTNMRYSIRLSLERPYERYSLITFKTKPIGPIGIILHVIEFVSIITRGANTGEEVFQEYFELLQEFTSE